MRPYAVGAVLAAVVLTIYLTALGAWPEDQARALAFGTLLASQPVLLLSMRTPEQPLWVRGRPWTRTLTVVIATLIASTLAVVYVPALADLLHLAPFPAHCWLLVIAAAITTAWSEPFKHPHDADPDLRPCKAQANRRTVVV